MKIIFTLLLLLGSFTGAFAQAAYQLGDKAEPFSLKDSNNREVSLKEFSGNKAVVVVFTNNQCPYAKLYETRLTSLASSFSGKGVQFIFVNPSINRSEGGEGTADMAAKNYPFPYLGDPGQKVTSRFGATKTPEVFVLHNVNGEFVLKYRGAIDDNPQAENLVKEHFLKNAVEAVLNNQPLRSAEKRATGCMIRQL